MPSPPTYTRYARASTYGSNVYRVVDVAHDAIHEWLTLSTSTTRPLPRALVQSNAISCFTFVTGDETLHIPS